ncbi:ATP-binding protein [Sandaracinus amylolyticus]|uniref:sensor histidine kinase n=1 Tax=Sandaracinus amylolyticus TaxID=927083 RepID=UPI001F37F866|nr:ATP-binding protein [Sandaracinus amylolyticus]UJR82016.1 Integral membrane sensor signal transduction histidine kinase [Sandaracinus amylolyticus]
MSSASQWHALLHGAEGAADSGAFATEPDDFRDSRVRWLIRLRWGAITFIALGAIFSWAGLFPGLHAPMLACIAIVAAGYNTILAIRRTHHPRAGIVHAIVDMAILTAVLWASGGVHTPFIANYIFHVAVVGILGGARATFIAAGVALLASAALWATEHVSALRIATWDPVAPWDLISELVAFGGVLGAVAYIVSHAVRELRERELALARIGDAVALEYEVLSNTLSELDAGLEVVDGDGTVIWRNKRAAELSPYAQAGGIWSCPGEHRPCQGKVEGECPVRRALAASEPGRCRFAATVEGIERVYEMLVFPLATAGARKGGPRRAMNLYLDRTSSVIDERGLILAERLASLGRVTTGVAHELNTPLATIRTLAADMQKVLRDLEHESAADTRSRLIADAAESAAIVQDETRRLGRITQGLLTGGDVVRAEMQGEVPLAAVVERARALVFAGMRRAPPVEIGEGVDQLGVVADRDRLVQVIVNLLQNAYDAVREQDDGRVYVSARYDEAEGRVELVIDDDGPGISEEFRQRLFEPFATTKPPGQGTGLGLYTSYMLVRAMQGTIELVPREGGGTRARVVLPAARAGAIRTASSAPREGLAREVPA